MKINEKDVASGLFFILVAVAGLYINGGFLGIGLEQHALGNPRRMGPGYMPMLVLWGLLLLGALVLVLGLFEGPDPLQRWTGVESGVFGLSIVVGLVVGYARTHHQPGAREPATTRSASACWRASPCSASARAGC